MKRLIYFNLNHLMVWLFEIENCNSFEIDLNRESIQSRADTEKSDGWNSSCEIAKDWHLDY